MATTATFDFVRKDHTASAHRLRSGLGLVIAAGLPVAVLGMAEMAAMDRGMYPFFFAPFGLPYWMGQAAHVVQLALLGAAFWAIQQRNAHTPARFWLLATIAAFLALPFVTPFLDELQLSLVCTTLFLLGAATLYRVAKVSKLAGWLMFPMLGIVGLSATMGLAVAAYAPPFALLQANNPPPAV